MRWRRCCERRKSATPALTDFALIALSSKKPSACAISEGTPKSSSLTSSKESRCTKEKSTTAETMYPVVKSTMIYDGPPFRLTKSTDAATATGSLHRFIGWSLRRRLMAVSRKFSLGSWNQWPISKETRLRISRKYFVLFKKRTDEGSPPFPNRSRPRRRSRPRPLVSGLVIEKAVIDRTNRMIPLPCKEVEDENDDEVKDDWGSGGRELRPNIAAIVCIKAIDQSGQHCYNTPEHFLRTVSKLYVNRGFLL